tara:strand:- start:1924 stop:2130 length:207 start_codon:yes stop_codon:yes gene_type:complete
MTKEVKMAKDDKEEVEEKEEKKGRYELVEVPTQTALVVKDNDTDKMYQQEQAMVEILNKLDKIDKNTG